MHRVGEKRRFQQSSPSVGLSFEPPEKRVRVLTDHEEREGGFSNVKSIFQGALHSIFRVLNTVKSMLSSSGVPRSPSLESPTVSSNDDSIISAKDSTVSFSPLSEKSRVVTSTPGTDGSPFPSLAESNIQRERVLPTLRRSYYLEEGSGAPHQATKSFPSTPKAHRDYSPIKKTNVNRLSKVAPDMPSPAPTKVDSQWSIGRSVQYNPGEDCQTATITTAKHPGELRDAGRILGPYSSLDSRQAKTLFSVGNSKSLPSSQTEHIRELYSTTHNERRCSLDHHETSLQHGGETVLEVGSNCQLTRSPERKDHVPSPERKDRIPASAQQCESRSSSFSEWMRNFKLDYKHSQAEQQAMMEAARAKLKLQQQKRMRQEDKIVAELRKGLAHTYMDSDEEDEDSSSWGLSVQQQERVTMAITRGSEGECLSERFRIRVTRGDLHTLTGSMWLNDEVINFYFNLISECCKKEKGLRVHVFNSFFYPKLSQSGYGGVRRWTKKVNLFEHDLILLPVHLGMHWCLAAIDLKSHEFLYYDSLLGTNPACLARLRDYLRSESLDKRKIQLDLSDWHNHTPQNIPRQRNGSDCGVFTCMYARHKAWRIPFNHFSQDDMEDIRQHMIYEILEQTLI